jgi:undecaprenyl-diphosphatase
MDPQLLQLLVLAVVQGIGEFLPISSSGHLLLVGALWDRAGYPGLGDKLTVEILLHGGTLLAILVVYWRRLWRLLGADRRVIGLLVVGTLPAVVVGLPLHEIEAWHQWLESPLLAGCMLPVTGMLLLWASRRSEGTLDYTQMTYGQAFLIGLAQAVAILPGVSRSGATIVAGLALGLRREAAASFSFLLAVPAISGALVLGLRKLAWSDFSSEEIGRLGLATAVSFFVGLAALAWLLRWLRQGGLQPLAWWCIAVGLSFLVWSLAGEPWPRPA